MKTTMTPSSRGLNVNCEMVEAFEAVLPQSILAKLEPFSFAICCKDGGYVICLQSFKALSDDVYHGPLTKYIDKNNWFGFVDDVKSKPEYKARLAELHVPAAIAPEIELLELYEQWNDYNEYVIDKFIRFDTIYVRAKPRGAVSANRRPATDARFLPASGNMGFAATRKVKRSSDSSARNSGGGMAVR